MRRLFIVIPFILSACYSGPKAKDDSFLKSLNGNSYETQALIGVVPIGKRRLTRFVQGQVKCNPGLDQVPVNHAQVDLYSGDKMINTAFTDREGQFSIAFDYESGHSFEMKIWTAKWERRLKLNHEGRGIAGTDNNLIFVECSGR